MAPTGVDHELWADERVALMKKLYLEGLSASQIAKRLNETYGSNYSRSAVTGKIWREKLNRTRGGGQSGKPIERVQPIRLRLVGAEITEGVRGGFISKQAVEVEDLAPFPILPGSTPRTLDERAAGMCCWPVGEETGADQLSCCRPVKGGKSRFAQLWCAEHHAQGTRPARETKASTWTPEQRAAHAAKIRAGRARKAA